MPRPVAPWSGPKKKKPKVYPRPDMPYKPQTRIALVKAPLSPKEMKFVENYVLDLDLVATAARCDILLSEAQDMLGRQRIQAAIQVVKSTRSVRTGIYADHVLRRWWEVVTADPRDIIELRRVNCRYCWGIDFAYQFTLNEHREAVRAHKLLMDKTPSRYRVDFDERGGVGFDRYKEANPDCPECMGEGVECVYLHDSRKYSPSAAALYQGVEITDKGKVRVLMRDKMEAEKLVGQHIGMFVNRNVNLNLDPTQLTDDQLTAAIEQFEQLAGGYADGDGAEDSGPLLEHAPQGEGEAEDG